MCSCTIGGDDTSDTIDGDPVNSPATPRGAVPTPVGTPALQGNKSQTDNTNQAKVDGKKHAKKFIEDFFRQNQLKKSDMSPNKITVKENDNKDVQKAQTDSSGKQNEALLTPTQQGEEHFNAGTVPRSQRGRPLYKTLSVNNISLPKSTKKVTPEKKAKIALKQRIGGRRNSSLKRYREGPVHNVVINKRTKNYEGQVCKGMEDDIEPEPPFNSDNYSDEKHLIVDGIIKEILSRINY